MSQDEPRRDPRSPFGRVMAFVLMAVVAVVGFRQVESAVAKGFFILLLILALATMVTVFRRGARG
jgi:hypothetical protein